MTPVCELILVTWNKLPYTKRCVESILGDASAPFRLIIVDNGSDADTITFLEQLKAAESERVRVLQQGQNTGWVQAVNVGLAQTRAPYVCLLNNDVVVMPGWLKTMVEAAESHPSIGLVNPTYNRSGASFEAFQEDMRQWRQQPQPSYIELNECNGACLLIRRSVLDRIGDLDEAYGLGGMDDSDYSRRAEVAGFRCVRATAAYVFHWENVTCNSLPTYWSHERRRNQEFFVSRWGRRKQMAVVLAGMADAEALRVCRQALALARLGVRIHLWMQLPPDSILQQPRNRWEAGVPEHNNMKWVIRPARWSGLCGAVERGWFLLQVILNGVGRRWKHPTHRLQVYWIPSPGPRLWCRMFRWFHGVRVEPEVQECLVMERELAWAQAIEPALWGRRVMTPPRLSAVLITRNEEQRLGRCLGSIRWVDEIVVVDDESTDRTRTICEEAGARVLVRRSGGDFDEQRNAGSDAASDEWILQLDADEVVPAALQEEIREALRAPGEFVAYRITRLNHFLGRPMRYGGWRWRGVKLFKKSAARYVGHSVHETLEVRGPVGELNTPILHFPFDTLTQLVARLNFYSDVEARLLLQQHGSYLRPSVLRYQLFMRSLKLFWKAYVKQAGWRDGMHGLVFAALSAWTHFLTWAKCWEAGLRASASSPVASLEPVSSDARAKLSVVVITKNEEARIARCLASVRWADELIVVDGESTDRTREIAESFGATIIRHAFDGSFSTDRNLGLEAATGDWVLQIDADDVATPEFRTAVQEMLATGSPHAALKFFRRTVFLGRRMRAGGWHYAVPNLLRRGRARYEGLVHERPAVQGSIGELRADIEHHPCEELAVFVGRQNRYTSLQAHELLRTLGRLPEREIRRRLWRKPWKTFWKSYVKKQGFRDGWHGLIFAEFFAGVELLKWAKYWELVQAQQVGTATPAPAAGQGVERMKEAVGAG